MDNGKALHGYRVAELPGGVATRYCGYLFARLGADVTVIAPNGSEDAVGSGADGLYGRWLDAGKSCAASLDTA